MVGDRGCLVCAGNRESQESLGGCGGRGTGFPGLRSSLASPGKSPKSSSKARWRRPRRPATFQGKLRLMPPRDGPKDPKILSLIASSTPGQLNKPEIAPCDDLTAHSFCYARPEAKPGSWDNPCAYTRTEDTCTCRSTSDRANESASRFEERQMRTEASAEPHSVTREPRL